MLHALVFFVLVAPLPVLLLLFVLQPLIIHIAFMALVEPVPVGFVLALIPVVIVLVVRIVDAPLLAP